MYRKVLSSPIKIGIKNSIFTLKIYLHYQCYFIGIMNYIVLHLFA